MEERACGAMKGDRDVCVWLSWPGYRDGSRGPKDQEKGASVSTLPWAEARSWVTQMLSDSVHAPGEQ